MVLITAGQAKVTRVDAEGNEHLLVIRGPGEVVGEISVLDGSVRSATVTALIPCITYVVASGRFLRIVREKQVEDILLRYVIARFRESEDARAELAMLPAMQRIARVLLRFAAVVGGEHPELDLSQDELAGATGLSRASVAAKLASLRRKGLIVTGRRSLVVRDLAGLRSTSALCLILDSTVR